MPSQAAAIIPIPLPEKRQAAQPADASEPQAGGDDEEPDVENRYDRDEDSDGALALDSRDAFIGDVFDELPPIGLDAAEKQRTVVSEMPLLDDAMARLPEALVSAMRERLRAEFRTVTSWQPPVKR